MSETGSVQERIVAVMKSVGAVKKSERNESQRFMFRGVDAIVNAVSPALIEHGVIVTPRVIDVQRSVVEVGQKRTQMGHVTVQVEYTFRGPKGDAIIAVVAAEAMDSGDKATAKAMSVAFRIALLQTLCLPTDEPDPDQDVYERAAGWDATAIQEWQDTIAGVTSRAAMRSAVAEMQEMNAPQSLIEAARARWNELPEE